MRFSSCKCHSRLIQIKKLMDTKFNREIKRERERKKRTLESHRNSNDKIITIIKVSTRQIQ
jgi:hypothetical protein